MARTLGAKDNFRVTVNPRGFGDFGSVSVGASFLYGAGPDAQKRIERDTLARCEEMAADIKRHVDNVGSVYVEFDQKRICEHCGNTWTEASSTYNGGCCAKDQDAYEAAELAKEPQS